MTKSTYTVYMESGSNNPDMEERTTILEQSRFESEDPTTHAREFQIKTSTTEGVEFQDFE